MKNILILEPKGHQRKPSAGRICGKMKLSLSYREDTLYVMVHHIENLSFSDSSSVRFTFVIVCFICIRNLEYDLHYSISRRSQMHMSKFTYILIQQKWQREKLKLWGKTVIQASWKCLNTEFPLKWWNVAHYRPQSGTTVSSRRTCSWAPSPCPWRRWTWAGGRRGGTAWGSFTDDSVIASTTMNLH